MLSDPDESFSGEFPSVVPAGEEPVRRRASKPHLVLPLETLFIPF